MRSHTYLLAILVASGCGDDGPSSGAVSPVPEAPAEPAPEPVPELEWGAAPADPADLGPSGRPRLVRLEAPWCQWCRIFEHEVLPSPEVRRAIASSFEALEVNVDAHPLWMDVPGFEGLPTLVFFNRAGQPVLTRSGYRTVDETVDLVNVAAKKLEAGEMEPYPEPERPRQLGAAITPGEARAELDRLEQAIFMKVNSHDGGFHTPARHPFPGVLLEVERWQGKKPRSAGWVDATIRSALRGSSPRLLGEPLDGLPHDRESLVALSAAGRDATSAWTQAVRSLPAQDPYRGIQDPVDHGVFRYAAGPGWYHPHFERRATDNLHWVLLLRARGEQEEAAKIANFVLQTFARGPGLDAVQHSDPFYYRLRADEREGVPPPTFSPQLNLDVQALTARAIPERCAALEPIAVDRWPGTEAGSDGAFSEGSKAPPDAVGELLVALASCDRTRARALADVVVERWRGGLPVTGRLFRLAAGVCAAAPEHCAEALGATRGLELDLDFPPPLHELGRAAKKD